MKHLGVVGVTRVASFPHNPTIRAREGMLHSICPCDPNFNDSISLSNDYAYDKNGNLTKDSNKKISLIQYNSLNLPSKINYSDGKYMEYVYSATGEKQSVTFNVLMAGGNYTYCDNFIYYNGSLSQILVDGGYISFNGSTPTYYYYLKDHLGSNRVTVKTNGTVINVSHYYPFGGLFGESTGVSDMAYKYNGKEFERLIGLDWYDYGARYMDCMRFTTMDPMAEKYYNISPYVYCANNPIRFIDLFGQEPTTKEAAYIADHVYGKNNELIGGWHQYYSNSTPNGLKYGIYEREMKNGKMEYVLAFAGTDDIKDIQQDISQFFNTGPVSQYGNAITLGRKFASLYDGYEKTIVGHSLGGGLATAAAMATDIPAITFNPASMTTYTKVQLGIMDSTGKNITNYVITGEPLSVIQNKTNMHLPGCTNYIFVNNTSSNPFVNSIIAHKISTIKKILPR